ncbi:uncharacterized protein B0T15DRAFT_247808 [Chaetomium strumarium]|uniref:Secreted protein n=1 Tax=Chaetomium strumarium TaxID=1170767 RepID=A0AAJ0GR29_9PEZI|nr:hypothetical protein B0T15DRAFT_247808 [Chaetomium strumarium]
MTPRFCCSPVLLLLLFRLRMARMGKKKEGESSVEVVSRIPSSQIRKETASILYRRWQSLIIFLEGLLIKIFPPEKRCEDE